MRLACDAENSSVYMIGISSNGDPIYGCRCTICSRCRKHTGNSNQGHHWKYCLVTKSMREFHFCCPDNCELEGSDELRKEA